MENIFNQKPYTFDRVVRIVIALVVIAIIYIVVRRLSDVLLPFVIGFLMAYYLNPMVVFFQKKLKIKNRGLAIVLTILLFLITFTGIGFIFIPQIIEETQKLSTLVSNYTQNVNLGSFLPPAIQTEINDFIAKINIKDLLSNESFTNTLKNVFPKLWSFINGSISFILSFVVVIFTFVYMIFILIDYDKLTKELYTMVPQKYRTSTQELSADIQYAMNQYFRGQGLVALLTGIVLMIGFSIINLPMAILMGAIIGVLNMVPYLQGLGLIPAALLGILKAAETGQNLWMVLLSILIVFIIAQMIQDYFLVPRIMKKFTGLRPAVVMLSLSVWGSLLGFIGLIIALPLTVVLLSYYKRIILGIDDNIIPVEIEEKEEKKTDEKSREKTKKGK